MRTPEEIEGMESRDRIDCYRALIERLHAAEINRIELDPVVATEARAFYDFFATLGEKVTGARVCSTVEPRRYRISDSERGA